MLVSPRLPVAADSQSEPESTWLRQVAGQRRVRPSDLAEACEPTGCPTGPRRGLVIRQGGKDDVPDAEAPEFAGYDGGVGHAAAWFDAGDEGCGPGPLRDSGE